MNQIQIIREFKKISNQQVVDVCSKTLSKLNIQNKIIEIEAVSKERIKEINNRYRKIDKATDVLSFPLTPTPNVKNLLGNIYICETVAEEKGIDIEELIKHGLLHLAGYDHEENEHNWDQAAKNIGHSI